MQMLSTITASLTSLLIHSSANTGKTALLGSVVEYEKQFGSAVLINVRGEPYNTLAAFDLTNVEAFTVDTLDELQKYLKSLPVAAKRVIVLDSLTTLNDLAEDKETGGTRAAGGGKSGESTGGQAEWGRIKFNIRSTLEMLKQRCEMLVVSCGSERGENDVTKQRYIVTDLVGKLAAGIARRFDFVGYLEMDTLSPTVLVRKVSFHPRIDALTRCNTRKPATKAFTLSTDVHTVWPDLRKQLEETL